MSTPKPEPCGRFCLCPIAQARRAEEQRMWAEALAELPEATASLSYYDGQDHEQ